MVGGNERRRDLYSGLGVILFDGPQGHGFYKGGHDGQTANSMVCIEDILGDTGVPYEWEYGGHAGKS